jgi:hypothetical protein
LQRIIDYFAEDVTTSDGSEGWYQAVEKQVIASAKEVGEGAVSYHFEKVYEFANFLNLIFGGNAYSFGESKITGDFDGNVRKEIVGRKEYLVINGVMTYKFEDEFKGPFEKVERTQILYSITREEAEKIVSDETDKYGNPYNIKDLWQTKFNATIVIE